MDEFKKLEKRCDTTGLLMFGRLIHPHLVGGSVRRRKVSQDLALSESHLHLHLKARSNMPIPQSLEEEDEDLFDRVPHTVAVISRVVFEGLHTF